MQSERLGKALRRGLWVAVALAVLTVVDYLIPIQVPHGNVVYLALFSIAEAAVVAYYFMHIRQLWHPHEEE